MESKLTVKIFVGCLLTAEARLFLQNSLKWKHALIEGERSSHHLLSVHYENKDYVGKATDKDNATLEELDAIEKNIRQQMSFYCPELDTNTLKIMIFPQILVS